jgi:outer membrane protein assembly factor BamE (lipoprotein component of BamABCDE complex)
MVDRALAALALVACTAACMSLRPRTTLDGRPFNVIKVEAIHSGLTESDVREILGEPFEITADHEYSVWRYYERFTPRGCDPNPPTISREFRVRFLAGLVVSSEGAMPRPER